MQSKRVVKNAAWIIACRVIQSVLTLAVNMLTARYLGPSNYGIINYAASVVAFVVPIMQLGFRNILVNEFIKNPEEEGTILGTALVFNLISSLLCILGIVSFVSIANRGETDTIIVCSLYSLNLLFQALEMSQYWFQAKLLSKYTSIVSLCAYAVVSAYKIYLLIAAKSVYWFAVSQALDFGIIAIALLIIYRRIGNQKLAFSLKMGKKMLSVGKYYIFSSMMVTVFGHIGSIFLKFMMDDAAVGYYSAAVSCTGMTSFVFAAVIDSARPSILEKRQNASRGDFDLSVVRLYVVVILLSLLQGIGLSVCSPLIVSILYGAAYEPTVVPLRIMAWYAMFSYLGTVRNVWILAEEKQKYLWVINLVGAVANILLNLLLIPLWGITGAAMASVMTQIITNIVVGYVMKPIRENNRLMAQALNPKNIIGAVKLLKLLRR